MPKRRLQDSADRFDADDNPIGLTSAFAPVKGPQSVDYDTDDDPVGLTQAFGAVPEPEEPPAWEKAGKWKDFDWDSTPDSAVDASADRDGSSGQQAQSDGADKPAEEAQLPDSVADAVDESPSEPAAHAASSSVASGSTGAKSKASRGRHAAPEPELSPRMKKSQRTRRVLIVLVVLLILVVGAVGFFWYRTWVGSHQEAAQQTQEQAEAPSPRAGIAGAPTGDAAETKGKLADVPDLAGLLGKNQDETLAAIGRGALVTSNSEVNEEGNPIKLNLTVSLSEEPAGGKTGTPTVYLGLGEDGAVRQAGYSASASALGFGALSFADAVNNEHVIEKTLAKVGVDVAEGSAKLPANKDEYSTYASDGTTVVRERCSFEGDIDVNGTPCTWSAVLSYDYTTQVVTGNLNDTVRIIYVYITAK